MTAKTPKTAGMNLSEKLARLGELERYFQEPELNLDEALEKHKEAVVLGKEILSHLEHAESELEKIQLPSAD